MFDNTGNIFHFNYEVQLEDVIEAICDISFDIGLQVADEVENKEKGFSIIDLFKIDFLDDISTIRTDSLVDRTTEEGIIPGYTKQEFFSYIADYYNKMLFYDQVFLDALNGSDILLVDKEGTSFLGAGDKAKDRLIPALKNAKILKKLITNLKSDKIQRSLQKIDTFENDIFYRNTIKATKQEGQPLLPFIKLSFLDAEKIYKEKVDSGNFWINVDAYQARGIDLSGDEEYYVLIDKENDLVLGLLIKDNVIPYANVDLVNYVKVDELYNYYWILLKYTYSTKPSPRNTHSDEALDEFKALLTDTQLNQLLSKLKNNFYIKDKAEISEKFLKFFNDVVILEKLESLENYSFLMSSNHDQETVLGIYNTERIGTNYNLLHWLNHKGEKAINHFRGTVPNKKDKTIIHSLKPVICYYFLEKYFEDLFEHILNANNYKYLVNRNFIDKSKLFCEIDFFVRTDKTFYYFETKTKLSRYYIDDFLKKVSKMMDKFKPMTDNGIEIEYILVAGYSDSSVSDYQYFINNNQNLNGVFYNTSRAALNSKPYYFNVPVPDKEGKQITCIAEPEYNNLENLVKTLCPK